MGPLAGAAEQLSVSAPGIVSWAALVLAAYLLGSVPVGYLVSRRWSGIDIRRHGSGNVGATNVLRTLGPGPGAVVLAGDVLKGALAAWIGLRLGGPQGAAVAGVVAVLGHAWPVFLGFSGGKSVATGFGAVAVLAAWVALAMLAIWGVVVIATRYVSLGSLVSASSAPVMLWLAFHDPLVMGGGLAMTLIVVGRHRANVRRLLAGNEHRLGARAR